MNETVNIPLILFHQQIISGKFNMSLSCNWPSLFPSRGSCEDRMRPSMHCDKMPKKDKTTDRVIWISHTLTHICSILNQALFSLEMLFYTSHWFVTLSLCGYLFVFPDVRRSSCWLSNILSSGSCSLFVMEYFFSYLTQRSYVVLIVKPSATNFKIKLGWLYLTLLLLQAAKHDVNYSLKEKKKLLKKILSVLM